MTKFVCSVCGEEFGTFREAWWHLKEEHNCKYPSNKIKVVRSGPEVRGGLIPSTALL